MAFDKPYAAARILSNFYPKNVGEKLVSETKSEIRFVRFKCFSDGCLFCLQMRVFFFLVHVRATPQNNQAVIGRQIRNGSTPDFYDMQLQALAFGRTGEMLSRPLPRHVLEYKKTFFHRHSPST